jgi:glycosyltransferase involved in cell wall biosynthesis
MATVLVDRGYPTTFNTPRQPKTHTIVRSRMSGGLRHLWQPLDGVGLWNPLGSFDLVHSFNKIPLWSNQPWMITFESILPRTLGRHQEILRDVLRERLLSPQCRGIIAISDYAVRRTAQFLAGWDQLPELLARIEVIPPNIQPLRRRREYTGGPLSLLFIGHDFARKGGITMLRTAKLAQARGLPLHFHIISNLHYGKGIYADFQDAAAYAEDMKLLALPNITLHGSLPNAAVMKLIEESHFVLLPTLHDTYGYSPLEGMCLGVPTIASATAAIPEFVKDGENGFLLRLPNDDIGEWIHLRKLPLQWADLDEAYDSLAHAAIARLTTVVDKPELWNRLSDGALEHIVAHHDAGTIASVLEQRYSAALDPEGVPRTA